MTPAPLPLRVLRLPEVLCRRLHAWTVQWPCAPPCRRRVGLPQRGGAVSEGWSCRSKERGCLSHVMQLGKSRMAASGALTKGPPDASPRPARFCATKQGVSRAMRAAPRMLGSFSDGGAGRRSAGCSKQTRSEAVPDRRTEKLH